MIFIHRFYILNQLEYHDGYDKSVFVRFLKERSRSTPQESLLDKI